MRSYRSVFISDVHLGTADCQAEYLLDFLNQVRCETLYLVGDIIDLIAMQRRVHFPDSHRAVIHKLIELAASGTRVVYVPGTTTISCAGSAARPLPVLSCATRPYTPPQMVDAS